MKVCATCNTPDTFPIDSKSETRPYGERGALICWRCANASPEQKSGVRQRMSALFEAASSADEDGIAAIGTEHGPLPLGTALRVAAAPTKEK